jgi:hypothetical protein
MTAMPRQRFLAIWFGFALLYTTLAAIGPNGLLETGVWPFINQHLLQVRAWIGEDIVYRDEATGEERVIELGPSLDVTAYFRTWVIEDPRERVLLANLACGVREPGNQGGLAAVRYLRADSLAAQLQAERLECHVGSPLGPAFLLLPLRLVFGSAVATQWLGPMLGGLAVALMDLLLLWWLGAVSGARELERSRRRDLLVLAGLGTLWIWLVPQGVVWMFAQTVATCCLTLSLVLAWRRRCLTAGLAYALAFLSRPTTLLAAPLLLAVVHFRFRSRESSGEGGRHPLLRAVLMAAVFPLLLGGTHLALNAARFGSPLEAGYRFMITPPDLRQRIEAHGPIDTAFVGENVRYQLLQPPVWVEDTESGELEFPYLVSDPKGMGVFFVTPAFLLVFLTAHRQWRAGVLLAACWISVGLVTLPSLLYFNTGWVQWGGRYLLDSWPMLLLLSSLGLQRIHGRVGVILIVLSAVSNLWGAALSASGWWP